MIRGRCIECGHCAAICPAGTVTNPAYDMADVENRRGSVVLDPEALVYTLKFRRSIRQYQPRPVEQELKSRSVGNSLVGFFCFDISL